MATRRDAMRARLADVPAEKWFWCHGGGELRNLKELASALQDMSEDAFRHHVTEQNNDFSNWVRDVIGDTNLAKNLSKATQRTEARQIVEERLAWLRERL